MRKRLLNSVQSAERLMLTSCRFRCKIGQDPFDSENLVDLGSEMAGYHVALERLYRAVRCLDHSVRYSVRCSDAAREGSARGKSPSTLLTFEYSSERTRQTKGQ